MQRVDLARFGEQIGRLIRSAKNLADEKASASLLRLLKGILIVALHRSALMSVLPFRRRGTSRGSHGSDLRASYRCDAAGEAVRSEWLTLRLCCCYFGPLQAVRRVMSAPGSSQPPPPPALAPAKPKPRTAPRLLAVD